MRNRTYSRSSIPRLRCRSLLPTRDETYQQPFRKKKKKNRYPLRPCLVFQTKRRPRKTNSTTQRLLPNVRQNPSGGRLRSQLQAQGTYIHFGPSRRRRRRENCGLLPRQTGSTFLKVPSKNTEQYSTWFQANKQTTKEPRKNSVKISSRFVTTLWPRTTEGESRFQC